MKNIFLFFAKHSTHPFIKGSAVMFGGTMIANVLAYFYHLVVGRILGPVGYGELAALLSIFYILNAPSIVLQNILVKFFSQMKATGDLGQAKRMFLRISRFVVILEAVLFVILIPFIGQISQFLHITDRLNIIWLYLMFCGFIISVVNISVLQAFQKFSAMTLLNAMGGAVRLIFGAIGSFFGVGWALFSNVISAFAAYGFTFLPLRFLFRQKETVIRISPVSALLYSVPACIAVVAITALYSQDVVLVKHFFSAEEAGIYSSLSVLGKIIFFASSALGAVAFPMLAERQELGKPVGKIIFASLGTVACISFGITLFYYLFPELVVTLLFGRGFMAASGLLASFGLFISFFTLSYLFTTMYLALGKTKVWIPTGLAAIVQIVVTNGYHTSLSAVIWNNTLITAGLFIVLLVYYPYATRRT